MTFSWYEVDLRHMCRVQSTNTLSSPVTSWNTPCSHSLPTPFPTTSSLPQGFPSRRQTLTTRIGGAEPQSATVFYFAWRWNFGVAVPQATWNPDTSLSRSSPVVAAQSAYRGVHKPVQFPDAKSSPPLLCLSSR